MRRLLLFYCTLGAFQLAYSQDITNLEWTDFDSDGDLDRVELTFSEPVAINDNGGAGDGFSAISVFDDSGNDYDIFTLDYSSPSTTTMTLRFDGNQIPGTSPVGLVLSYSSGTGSSIVTAPGGIEITTGSPTVVDAAQPQISAFRYRDDNLDGLIESFDLIFSETISASSVVRPADLSIAATLEFNGTFGSSTVDRVNFQLDQVNVRLGGAVSTIPTTYISTLTLTTQGNFSLIDLATTPNVNSMLGPQDQAALWDGAAPIINGITYRDLNENGLVDELVVSFSEEVQANSLLTLDNLSIEEPGSFGGLGIASSTSDLIGSNASSITISSTQLIEATNTSTFEETGDFSLRLSGTYTLNDGSSNRNQEIGVLSNLILSDDAAPIIVAAFTRDTNLNGSIDQIEVILSESISDGISTLNAATISVSDYDGDFASSGNTSDDNTIIVSITEGMGIDTDATPEISLAANTIRDGAMNSIGAAQSFGVVSDGAGPMIVNALTLDTDENGFLDRFALEFSESIDDSESGPFDLTTLFIEGYSNPTKVSTIDDDIFVLIDVSENAEPDTDTTPAVLLFNGQVVDSDGNSIANQQNFNGTVDGAAPAIVAGSTGDANADGFIDFIEIAMSEVPDNATVQPGDFQIANYSIGGVGVDPGSSIITLNITSTDASPNPDTGVTPDVTLSENGISDEVPNSLDDAQLFDATTDQARPVIVEVEISDTDASPDGLIDEIEIRWSEVVTSSVGGDIALGQFGFITLPDDELVDGGVISPLSGASQSFVISEIDDQVTMITEAGNTSVSNILPGAWLDNADNGNSSEVLQNYVVVDAAAPVITEFRYEDDNSDGQIDQVRVFFSEPVDEASTLDQQDLSFTPGDFTSASFGSVTMDVITNDGVSEAVVPLQVVSSVVDTESSDLVFTINGGTSFELIDNTAQANSNSSDGVQTQAAVVDGAAPVITTVRTDDFNSNGKIDRLLVQFSETIAQESLDGAPNLSGETEDLSISDSYSISSVNTITGSDADELAVALIEREDPDTDATPTVTVSVTSGITDLVENTIAEGGPYVAEDEALPVIYNFEMHPSNAFLQVEFSEPISRQGGGNIVLNDFGIAIGVGSPNVDYSFSALDVLDVNGNELTSTTDQLLVQLNLSFQNNFGGEYNTDDTWVNFSTDETVFLDANGNAINSAQSTGNVSVNNLFLFPQITNAQWQTVTTSPFSGYIQLEFSEIPRRGILSANGLRIPGTLNNGLIDFNLYTGGTSPCADNELCLTYNNGGTGATIISDNNNDILLTDNSGNPIADNFVNASNEYRLELNDISSPFTGSETYVFSVRNGISLRGDVSDNFTPFNYVYEFQLPDLVPAEFSTAEFSDTDGDGVANNVRVSLAGGESFDDNTVNASQFSFGLTQLSSIVPDDGPNDNNITLSLEGLGLDGSEPLGIAYNGTDLGDSDGNQIATGTIPNVVDLVFPAVLTATTQDLNNNGFADQVELIFTEDVNDASIQTNDFDISSVNITDWNTGSHSNDDRIVLVIQETTLVDDNLHPLSYAGIEDLVVPANSNSDPLSQSIELADGVPPAISSAQTGDGNLNGRIDEISITFTQEIDFSTAEPTDFTVSVTGHVYQIEEITNIDGTTILLSLQEQSIPNWDTGQTPTIELSNAGIEDFLDNSLPFSQSFGLTNDGAAPAIVAIGYQDITGTSPGIPDGRVDAVRLVFSETLSGSSSTLAHENLSFVNASNFEGVSFGNANSDLIIGNVNEVVITLATPAINQATSEEFEGELLIQTNPGASGWSLTDSSPNSNSLSGIQAQAIVLDESGPVISELIYSSSEGIVDEWDVRFSEPIDGSASYLSLDNLVFSDPGLLENVDFGTGIVDLLPNDEYSVTPSPIVVLDPPNNLLTGDLGVVISLSNAGANPFIFQDPAGNSVTELELTGPGLVQNQATYVDAAEPYIAAANTTDRDSDGRIDRIEIELSETIRFADLDISGDAFGLTNQFTVDGYNISSVTTANDANSNIIYLNLEEGSTSDSNEEPQFEVTQASIFDLTEENALPMSSNNAVDGAGPVIVSALTRDTNANGTIDAVDLTFDVPILDASLDMVTFNDLIVSAMTIGSYNSDPFSDGATAIDDNLLRLVLVENGLQNTNTTPEITLQIGEVSDHEGNTIQFEDQVILASDGAAPVFLAMPDDNGGDGTYGAIESITFSCVASEPSSVTLDLAVLQGGQIEGQLMELIGGDANVGYTYRYTTPPASVLEDGFHVINFNLVDGEGNTGPTEALEIEIDNIIPTVTVDVQEFIEGPSNPIQVISGEFSANGDNDLASLEVEVNLNDGNGYQAANADAATGTWSFDTDQNIGIYNIDARVTDLFGNQFIDDAGIDELQIGGVTINAPTLNNICIDGVSLTLDPVVISERKVNDFKLGNGVSFSIDLPEGFFYNVSNTPSAPTGGHPELANFSFSYLGPQSLRIVFDVLAEDQTDVLEIHNIQVQAVGMTPANAFASYSQGTASIFGVAPDATLANLNSVSAASSPLLMTGSSVGEVVGEVEVELGDETFTLYTEGSGVGYNWYNFAGNLVHEGAEAMLSQLVDLSIPAEQGNTGFDPNAAGLYSIFVGETNVEGCESSLQKVNVYVYDRQLDPARFSYVETDDEGVVLRISNDEEQFEGKFVGVIGLEDFDDDPAENLSSVRFVPSLRGLGAHPVTYEVQNLVTNQNYGFETTFIVNAEQSIFSNEVADAYCRNDDEVDLNVDTSDIEKSENDPESNFFFYGLRLLESSTLDEVGGVLVAPSGWDADEFDSDQPVEGWGFEPVNLAQGEYIIERLIIREADIDASNLQVLNRFSFNVYENPIASISAPFTSICVEDEAFNFSADLQLGSTRSSVVIDQYIISHVPEDARAAYGEDVIISGNQFNPANPLDLAGSHPEGYPFGTYAVSYLSDLEDNRCTDLSDEIELTVLPKPQPAYPQGDGQNGDVIAGHGMRNGNEYLLEYCTGEEIGEFSFSVNENEAISVFSNPSLTNEIEIDGGDIPGEFVITAAELVGSNQAIGGIDEDFYVVFQTNTDLNGGCPSDAVTIRLVVRDIPENPQLDLSGSEAGSQVDGNTYEFNYCTSDELFASSLEPLLFQGEANAESYFNVYTAGTSEPILEEVQDLEFILSSEAFNFLQLTPGSSNLLQFERIDFDNSVLSNPPQEGQEFVGCTSSRTDVWINVFDNSQTPSVAAFSDSPNEVEGVITYYLCQGEEIDFSINPPDGINDYLYEWFEGVDDTNPISVQDLQGDRVRTQDLIDEDFGFDPNIPGTYAMSVRINTNVRPDANFSGCASSLKRVDIVVNESAESPLIEVSEADEGELTGGFSYAFDFCVEGSLGLPGQTQFAANLADETKIGEVQWFTANEDGTEIQGLNPVAFGSVVSATNLGIANSLSDEFEFAVINIVNSVNSNDFFEGFEGCISEPVFVKVRVNTLPEPNFAIQGETEGRGTTFDFVDNALDQESSVTLDLDANTVFEEVLQVNLSSEDFSYNFSNSGVVLANLRIESMAGCAAEIAKDFRILDQVVGGAQYINDFEEPSNDPWFAEYRSDDGFEGSVSEPVRLSTWRLDEVNGTGEVSQSWDEGILAWTTLGSDNLGYVGGERSFVYSPSYDISSIQNPAVRFRSIRDLDQRDGVVFQYSVDDGAIWVTLGDYVPTNDPPSSGQEWYTESGITSVPGNVSVGNGSGFNPERVGWSSQYTFDERQRLESSNGWASSVHSLTLISNDDLRNIRFRFALGSSGVLLDEKTGDGFGFDDFEFISQSKVLLVEQFSSTLSEDSKIAEQAIPGVVDTDQVMVINYMTDQANNTSQSDQLNNRNSRDPGARSAYYGINGVPQSVLNGELFDKPDDQNQLSWNSNDVDLKVLDDAQYNIRNVTATLDQSGGVISVSADFSSFFDAAQGDVSFYFAVVEKEISGVESGLYQPGEVIQNVLRVLLPGPSGFNYVGPIASGEVFSYSVDWIVDNVYNPEQLRVVIFVQNNESKEVLQTAFIDIEGALETVLSTAANRQFSVYPNPADEWVAMRLPNAVDNGHMVLFDQSGKKLLEQPCISGQSEPSLDVSSIQDGIYYLSFYENANSVKVSKVIISH